MVRTMRKISKKTQIERKKKQDIKEKNVPSGTRPRKRQTARKTGERSTVTSEKLSKPSKKGLKGPVRRNRQRKKQVHTKRRELWFEVGLSLLFLSLILTIILSVTIRITKIEGYSMSPSLNDSEWVLVNKQATIKRFDFVYLRQPNSDRKIVSRVIGLPEETITYQEGILYVDNQEVSERFFSSIKQQQSDVPKTEDFDLSTISGSEAGRIPAGYYFVLGDNRPYATDSRYFGLVPEKELIGKVTTRILPLHNIRNFI